MLTSRALIQQRTSGVASIPFVTLGVYLVTSIFYVLPSGGPQPADFLLVIGIALTFLLSWRTIPREPALYLALGLFVIWITLVNSTWFMMIGENQFLKKTSFYYYNAIVLLFVTALGYHDFEKLKKTVWLSCIVALFAQALFLLLAAGDAKRATGTFNNPNQMGYWVLLTVLCLAVARDRKRITTVDMLALCAAFYSAMLSLSKATLISLVLAIGLVVMSSGVRLRAAGLLLAMLVCGLVMQMANGDIAERIMSLDSVAAVVDDMNSISDDGEDDVVKRGYQRLYVYSKYLIFGAGEGDFARFRTGGRSARGELDREFHSSLGNILMSYGIIGLVLFFTLLFVVFNRAYAMSVLYLLPVMLYGITHNGLRFSLFWVFLGMVFAQKQSGKAPMH